MRKTTLKDIAQAAQVSAMTVSKAINNKPGVSAQTREKILEIARELHYSQNQIARSLRFDKTQTIGMVLSDSSEMVVSKVLRGVLDCAESKGYSVITVNTDRQPEREIRAIDTLCSKQVDGILLTAPMLCSDEDIDRIRSYGVPFVYLMRSNDRQGVDAVLNDNYLGGYRCVAHLIEQGCRRFCCIVLEQGQSGTEREKGYRQAFRDYGIPESDCRYTYAPPHIEEGFRAAMQMIEENRDFDGMVCGCDILAVGAMDALLKSGYRIPQDVKLIGYDGIEIGEYLQVPLTTMAQPLYQFGYSGTEILLERLHEPDMPVRKLVLNSDLIVRASSKMAE